MKLPFTGNNLPAAAPPQYEPKSVLDLRGSPSPVGGKSLPIPVPDSNHLEDPHALINPQLEDWDSWMRELGLNDDSSSSSPVSKPLPQENVQTPNHLQIVQSQYPNLHDFPGCAGSFDSVQFSGVEFGVLSDFPPVYGGSPLLTHNVNNAVSSFEGFSGGDLSAGNWNVGLDYVDELIRLAECFESNSVQLGHVILARLNERLGSPAGKPLQRAAFYFKEALQSLLMATTPMVHRAAGTSEIIQIIKAQKIFSGISPIPMFSSFSANQALLEAVYGGALKVHAIDFDICFGGHWASFMKAMAEKAEPHKDATPPVLRISAVVIEEYEMESNLVRENLVQFARELNIRFDIEFISIRSFEYLSFKAIKFMEGEKLAILLSPAIFRQIGSGFLNDLRRLSPHVVVHVDIEGQVGYGTASYRQAVINGLEFYSTLLESLEASNFMGAGGWDWMRRIETFVLYPKILEGVEAVGRRGTPVRESLMAAGLRPVILSQFADFQAECLLRRVQIRGFHVVKRQAEMLLCWHDRPLAAMSAWRY